jgi:hypothetical protein
MKYIDYINRGFERCELNDTVQYEETGYKGFYLVKKITKKVTVEVGDSELDNPVLYIEQKEGEFISLPLTPELVMNWFEKKIGKEI